MAYKADIQESLFMKGTKLLKNQEIVLCSQHGETARRKIEHLADENKQEYHEIWDDIVCNNEPGDIYKFFHLDYICSEHVRCRKEVLKNKKICVIAHLYYTDLIPHCFEYLKRIPQSIDIFITTQSGNNTHFIQEYILKSERQNIQIIESRNRGRDISALLVACKDLLPEYEYLCFVHDKKKNSGTSYQTVGQSFMDILWENTIKNGTYIENVLSRFENEPRLGLLSTPIPYMSDYFKVGALSWTGCFDKTVELAKRLNLNCIMEEEKHPFVLGTAFWCRTDALCPLFEGGFEYEDFEPEPMASDNTISHAIERILPFVAQSRGYYSGIVMTNEYASLYVSNCRYMLGKMINKYIKQENITKYADIPTKYERVGEVCRAYKDIYIYGAGNEARKYDNALEKEYGIDIKGFIVSAGHKKEEYFMNKPLYEVNEIEPAEDTLIILALTLKNRREVKPELIKQGFKNIVNI